MARNPDKRIDFLVGMLVGVLLGTGVLWMKDASAGADDQQLRRPSERVIVDRREKDARELRRMERDRQWREYERRIK